jgi:hypothetical protein
MLLAGAIGAAGYYTLGRGISSSPSPTPTVDPHSKEAVIAAIRAYYKAEDKAGETGTVDLVGPVTTGPGTPAYENLKQYFIEHAAKNRHSVTISDQFGDWQITLAEERATASYSLVQVGHDTEAATGKPVEADVKTAKTFYRATLEFKGRSWLMYERDYVREVPS